MGIEIKKGDEVWTADEQKLGIAQRLFHRIGDVDPDLKLYATYLEVEDFEFGESFYVPTDFLTTGQADSGRVDLTKKRAEAMQLTWARMPDFIAHGHYRQETLPE